MADYALIFYPDPFVGFNKTQLIKRHLVAIGVLGSKLASSCSFSAGQHFRQYIPKAQSIQKYHSGVVRIQIQAVGVWATATGQVVFLDRSNLMLIEGEAIELPLERYAPMCELLYRITGDEYRVDIAYQSAVNGICEEPAHYG
jgi:hypothetical protein